MSASFLDTQPMHLDPLQIPASTGTPSFVVSPATLLDVDLAAFACRSRTLDMTGSPASPDGATVQPTIPASPLLTGIALHPLTPLVHRLQHALESPPPSPSAVSAAVSIVEAFLEEGEIADISDLLPGTDPHLDRFMWAYTHLLRSFVLQMEEFEAHTTEFLTRYRESLGVATTSDAGICVAAMRETLKRKRTQEMTDTVAAFMDERRGKRRRHLSHADPHEEEEEEKDERARGRQREHHGRTMLRMWLLEHRENPYPSKDEKARMVAETGLSMQQINNFMINGRRRLLRRQ